MSIPLRPVVEALIAVGAVVIFSIVPCAAQNKFTPISKGLEYGIFPTGVKEAASARIHVLRIDPRQARLALGLATEKKAENMTAAEWCRLNGMSAAINAGMFLKDYKTNVGYLRNGAHVQNRKWNSKYFSVFAFNPKVTGIAPAVLVDLDAQDSSNTLAPYGSVVQNLRLMKADHVNVWSKADKRWSEAAMGMDREGRVLFIFCKYPFTMWQFNEVIKALGIGVRNMMHLEGGPMASFSIRTKSLKLDLAGSFETDFNPNDANSSQWAIPNVIGVLEN